MNITDSSVRHQCTSCQVCAAVCPTGAISINLDEDGYYRPFVDAETCIDCGLCAKTCYKYDDAIIVTTESGLIEKTLYSAWAKYDDLLKHTTSGGIGDILARSLIDNGYKVVGVVYDADKVRAEHRIATTAEETILFRGSKYIQSYTINALKEVVTNCKKEKYAVFGTPCQIYALNKLATLRNCRGNFVFVDLYCHGCPSIHLWRKYLIQQKQRCKVEHFDEVNFRSKIRGWGTFNVVLKAGDKSFFTNKAIDDGFYELFFSDHVLNEGCNDCKLRGTLEYTDIRLGDFWGKKFLANRTGVSAVSIATDRGQKLFDKIKGSIVFSECDYKDCLPYQSWSFTYNPKPNLRKMLLDSLKDEEQSITDAVRLFHKHQSLKGKLKRHVKDILRHFPLGVTMFLKKFVSA